METDKKELLNSKNAIKKVAFCDFFIAGNEL
jgi:hypothetical protein